MNQKDAMQTHSNSTEIHDPVTEHFGPHKIYMKVDLAWRKKYRCFRKTRLQISTIALEY